jgi:PAS domain S-box-containing protein
MKRAYTAPKVTKYTTVSDLPAELRRELERKAIVVFDCERKYTFVSESFAVKLGYTADELIGKRIDDITADNSVDIDFVFNAFLALGEMDGLWLCNHRDGRKILFHYRAHRSSSSGILYADVEHLPLSA